jgi:hypothetical protein
MNQEFIQLAEDQVTQALVAGTGQFLAQRDRAAFNSFDRIFVGIALNAPQLWVMGMRTVLAEEGSMVAQVHEVTVQLAVMAGEPELAKAAAVDYVWAVDQALRYPAAPWDIRVTRVFVQSHEYGPVYTKGQSFTRFPEVKVAVLMQEVP